MLQFYWGKKEKKTSIKIILKIFLIFIFKYKYL